MNNSFFDTLEWFTRETKNDQEPIVVYAGDQMQERSRGRVVAWKNVDSCIKI